LFLGSKLWPLICQAKDTAFGLLRSRFMSPVQRLESMQLILDAGRFATHRNYKKAHGVQALACGSKLQPDQENKLKLELHTPLPRQ